MISISAKRVLLKSYWKEKIYSLKSIRGTEWNLNKKKMHFGDFDEPTH